MNEQQRQAYFTEFDTLGEAKVRHMVEMNTWLSSNPSKHITAKEWLLIQESFASVERDALEKETLSIAKEANRLASEANEIARREATAAARSARYAMYAAAIAATAAISANKAEIVRLIFG